MGKKPDILQFFKYDHLRDENMRAVSKPFCDLAEQMSTHLPSCPEQSVALRKLLEAKDAAVRAWVWKSSGEE